MTVLADHPFDDRRDGRFPLACQQCGRVREVHPQPVEEPRRQLGYEDALLSSAEHVAQRKYNVPTDGHAEAVKQRLELGQQRYGVRYLRMSREQRAREMREEALDASAYAVLDAQARLFEGDLSESARWILIDIAEHAAAIDALTRQLLVDGD